jgi:RimJ/RimL family protein N-acetyltransferase
MTSSDDGTCQMVIRGEKVALGPLRRDLLETYQRWTNDLEVRRGRGVRDVYSLEAQEEWYTEASRVSPTKVFFTAYDLSDLAPIGVTELRSISTTFGAAELAVSLGERRGQGLGSEAVRLTIDWAFNILGLYNVMLEVRDWNLGAIKAYERAGFRVIGKRRGTSFSMGQRIDEVLMDAVTTDFEGSVLRPLGPGSGV